MLPSTSNLKTIVVDRSLAQLNSFQAAYRETMVSISRFCVLTNMLRRCGSLPLTVEEHGKRIHQRMLTLFFALTREFIKAISSDFPAALTYLRRAWLTWEDTWSHYSVKWYFSFGILTTNKVHSENRQLKHRLLVESTLQDVFSRILRRDEDLDGARSHRIV